MIDFISRFMDKHPAAGACVILVSLFAVVGIAEFVLYASGYGAPIPV